MKLDPDRPIFTVSRQSGAWVVEYDGENFGHSADKEVAKASAHKRAREVLALGRGCEVRVQGERGFLGPR